MNDSYAECLVKRKTPAYAYLFDILLAFVVLFCVFLALTTSVIGVILTFAAGFVAWLVHRNFRVEYEYLYVDRQFSVDKIFGRAKRKKVWEVSLDSIQIIAPDGSPELERYSVNNRKILDFSSARKDAHTYTMLVQSGANAERVIFEPDERLLKCIRQYAPSKVVQ
ncbi:MAG: DUF6106 family protein [Clostridiales bacterium]|nr:DUF6106 family protein [Clostridiales bacterium]